MTTKFLMRRRRPRAKSGAALTELMTPAAFDAVSRVDLLTFIERCFAEVVRGHEFLPNWHLELMCSHLQAVAQGRTRREIINVPPRSLKSICVSVGLVAWMLGHDPTKKIMVVSYGQELADKHARDTRQVMQSKWYRQMFPRTVLSAVRCAVADFETTAGGGRFATSFGGAVTGRGADLIIIDDPIKPEEALSARSREMVSDYLAHTLQSRFNNQNTGAMLVVMQRLHEDDLCGHLLERGGWTHLSLPAIAEADEVWTFPTPFGLRTVARKAGEALHPAHANLGVLDALRADMGAYVFAAQYQQRPAPFGGGLVKLDWFGRYRPGDQPEPFDYTLHSWDTANKDGELNDYSVCTYWGVKGIYAYLLSVDRKKMEYPGLKTRIMELYQRDKPNFVLIEDGASGQMLIQELRQMALPGLHARKAQISKTMRLMEVSSHIEGGYAHLPKEAPWLADYENEIACFPKGKHDDQVDSTSQALKWILERRHTSGIFQFIAEEAARNRSREEDDTPVRYKAPVSHLLAIDGTVYQRDADGILTVPRKHCPLQLAPGWVLLP